MKLLTRGACIAGLAFALAGTVTDPGLAHSDDGVFAGLEAMRGATPLEVSVRARLVYADDSDPAPGATVAVAAVGADGATTSPSPLGDNGDGTYQGTLMLPAAGDWTLRFTATTPTAATELPYAAPADTPDTTTTSVPTTATTRAANDDGGGSGGAANALVIALVAVVALVIVGAAMLVIRRRRQSR